MPGIQFTQAWIFGSGVKVERQAWMRNSEEGRGGRLLRVPKRWLSGGNAQSKAKRSAIDNSHVAWLRREEGVFKRGPFFREYTRRRASASISVKVCWKYVESYSFNCSCALMCKLERLLSRPPSPVSPSPLPCSFFLVESKNPKQPRNWNSSARLPSTEH